MCTWSAMLAPTLQVYSRPSFSYDSLANNTIKVRTLSLTAATAADRSFGTIYSG